MGTVSDTRDSDDLHSHRSSVQCPFVFLYYRSAMKYASVCSGVEAASLAWMPLGWKPIWFSEIEPFPCEVLKQRFPHVPNLGDMTKIKGDDYNGTVDVLVGGTPCQDFSVAGKQQGLEGSRSCLALSYIELLRTMRPTWIVWENVPGAFSTNKGSDIKRFIREITDIGYSCAWRVLDAQYCRVDGYPRAIPQRRRRVFVVGHSSGDWRYPAQVLFEQGSLFGNPSPCRVKGKGFTSDIGKSIKDSGRIESYQEVTGALCQSIFRGVSNQMVSTDQIIVDCTKAYGIGNGQVDSALSLSEECGKTLDCMHDHQAVMVVNDNVSFRIDPMSSNSMKSLNPNSGIHKIDVSPTLDTTIPTPSKNQGGAMVLNKGCRCYENHPNDSRVKDSGDVCPTLNARAGTGGGNLPLVRMGCDLVNGKITGDISPTITAAVGVGGHSGGKVIEGGSPTYAIAENIIGRKPCNGGNGNGYQKDLAYTQNATGVMGVMQQTKDPLFLNDQGGGRMDVITNNLCGTLRSEMGGHPPLSLTGMGLVRRLTPIECERLMGFPDNWTRIKWRNKPEEKCPDGPRYKACGNSMCVNVMRWIGMRIEDVERTMKGMSDEKRR